MPRNYIPKFTDPESPLYDKERAEKWLESRKKGGSDSSDSEPQSSDVLQERNTTGKLTVADIGAIIPDWKISGCTISEARFVAEYCSNGFDGPKAYMKAVNPLVKYTSAMHLASQMLNKKSVSECLATFSRYFIGDRVQQVHNKVMETLWTQAFYDISDYLLPSGEPIFSTWEEVPPPLRAAIVSIKTKVYGKDADREVVEVELADRKQAMKALLDYVKMTEARIKREQEAQNGESEEVESSMARIQKMFSKLQTKVNKENEAKFKKATPAEAVEVTQDTEAECQA